MEIIIVMLHNIINVEIFAHISDLQLAIEIFTERIVEAL
jgi:hypothetical protein